VGAQEYQRVVASGQPSAGGLVSSTGADRRARPARRPRRNRWRRR
jgi:hypothetical protein